MQLLLDANANIEATDEVSSSAVENWSPKRTIGCHNQDGFTPLLTATSDSKSEAVKLLLSKGANIEAKNKVFIYSNVIESRLWLPFGFHGLVCVLSDGASALLIATKFGFTDIVSMLLDNLADFESVKTVIQYLNHIIS